MTVTNHALAGAIIGTAIHQPILALPLALASHFVLDVVPHFGFKDIAERSFHIKLFWTVTIIDLILFFSVLYILLQNSLILALACAVLAYLPDLAWNYRFAVLSRFGKREAPPRNKFDDFHKNIQNEFMVIGLIFESFVFCGLSALFLRYVL